MIVFLLSKLLYISKECFIVPFKRRMEWYYIMRLKNPCFMKEWYCSPPKGTNDGLRRSHFFKNLRILNKDQRFKSKGMKKPARGKKKSRWMEKSRSINPGEWKNPARWKTLREFNNVWKKLFEAKKSVFHTGMVLPQC